MARAKNTDERLDDATIERVIEYLETKGATKKNACGMLNISYNTARLDKIIESYIQKKENDAKRRAEKRGKPPTAEEIGYVITEYLAGTPISSISNSIYRGTTFIKRILVTHAVPERQSSPDYYHPNLIPDAAVRESFNIGELVYSARYDTLAIIDKELVQNDMFIYRIWLKGNWLQFAYQPAYELASLEEIRKMGVSL